MFRVNQSTRELIISSLYYVEIYLQMYLISKILWWVDVEMSLKSHLRVCI